MFDYIINFKIKSVWNEEEIFKNHLTPMKRFYSAYLFSKSANLIFKILIDFLRDEFENRFQKKYSKTTTKNEIKIVQ